MPEKKVCCLDVFCKTDPRYRTTLIRDSCILLVFKIIEKKLPIAEISHTFIFIAMSTIAYIKPTYHLCM